MTEVEEYNVKDKKMIRKGRKKRKKYKERNNNYMLEKRRKKIHWMTICMK